MVKVITGIRRSGKSYLLNKLYRSWLREHGVPEDHILSISLEELRHIQYRNPITLAADLRKRVEAMKGQVYLFIDEIQLSDIVPNPFNPAGASITFYDALNDLRSIPNLDITVTGSNSRMLSTDVLTEFRGRGTEIRMHPLTFAEFFRAVGGPVQAAYEQFALYGGLPAILEQPDEESKAEYLQRLFAEVYIRDIIERGHIKRDDVLSQIIDLLSSAVGSLTNPTKIANTLKSQQKESISRNTVHNYLQLIEDAFLFSQSRRYNIRGRSYFDYPSKYYCEDIGHRNARLNFRQQEPTHIMENILYNDLKARRLSVDVGVVYARETNSNGNSVRVPTEIDFVANAGSKRTYIQSAYALPDEEKSRAELRPLRQLNDAFPRIIVQQDLHHRWYDESGVLHVGLTDFLLDPDIV